MSAIILHRRTSLLYYSSDRDGGISLPIPIEAMSDMEIVNEANYIRALEVMAGKIHTPSSVILVLADEMCYFAKATPDTIDLVREQLIRNTPFSHVETTVVRDSKQIFIIATNADIYESMIHAFFNKGITISMVLPWSALVIQKIVLTGEIDKVTVKRVSDGISMLKECSFPIAQHEQRTDAVPVTTHEKKQKSIPMGWVIFISIAVIYAIGMMVFLLRQ